MKKAIVSILVVFTVVLAFASGSYYRSLRDKDISGRDGIEKENDTIPENDVEDETTINPFFFSVKGSNSVIFEGESMFYESQKESLVLNISEIAKLEYGTVYELKFQPEKDIPYSRLDLGYFYVQEDRIYRVDRNKESFDTLIRESLIPSDSIVVCQNSEMEDALADDEKGFHQSITVDGEVVEYRSYDNSVETGWYESFTWEKGEGLVGYRSGFGAEKERLDVKAVKMTSQ